MAIVQLPAYQASSTSARSLSLIAAHVPPPRPVPTTPAQRGADGSTGNNLSAEYCAKNQDPGCPLGSYIAPNAIPNPNGDGTWVPCEGTICTNPNHGAGPDTTAPETSAPVDIPSTTPQSSGQVEGAPCEGDGRWVHLDAGNAGHYGTDRMALPALTVESAESFPRVNDSADSPRNPSSHRKS
ncbi:MAG: hypothetical protein JWN03_3648 [Nocardia sp.]|uniref:hypothetical protein n=1 Tax=Nocardia sp. TaxID=1821 RepID=UPI0026168881|nr:hypothetical protein [Nocardia sp.]MCU1643373.1 hypothetical protein [Nocardia sp.]